MKHIVNVQGGKLFTAIVILMQLINEICFILKFSKNIMY